MKRKFKNPVPALGERVTEISLEANKKNNNE